ncbi:MAG: large conductance mechanosensitive channel protein MscL [Nocardioidaceae bacterium]
MKDFKEFILRGNLVELAVAFVMAAAFAAVVTAFVQVILDVIGKLGGSPDFSSYQPGGVHVGVFLTALVAFLILAAVVYFFVVVPYLKARERFQPDEAESAPTEDIALLTEIRDLLREREGRA